MKKYNFIVTKPAGMTLIELLVVISILGLLTVVVLPALSGNRENNANRNASQQVSGLISQSRNDAISAGRWAGFTVLPPASGLSDNGLDIARCRVPPPYRGDLIPSVVRFRMSPSPNIRPFVSGSFSIAPFLNIVTANVQAGDFISFRGQPQRYEIASSPTPGLAGFNIQHVSAGGATPWPPTDVDMTFSIERQPRVVGSTISLSNESSIDMFWSGWGRVGSYNQFAAGDQVSVLFDDRGTLRDLVINGSRTPINGAVFFLIGRVDRRANLYNSAAGPSATDDTVGANWQYPTSYWVAIDPVSGQTRIAECVPGATTREASQQYVREGLISQGL
ncbi:MAG: Tfp pilus assembly protein FimT/FimU [Pirellulales bacterium]